MTAGPHRPHTVRPGGRGGDGWRRRRQPSAGRPARPPGWARRCTSCTRGSGRLYRVLGAPLSTARRRAARARGTGAGGRRHDGPEIRRRVEVDTELVVGDPATALLARRGDRRAAGGGQPGVGGFGGFLLGSTGVSASAGLHGRGGPRRRRPRSSDGGTALWSSGSTAPRPRRRCCRLRSTRRPADEHRCCSCTPGRCLCTGVISTPAATRPRPRRIAAGREVLRRAEERVSRLSALQRQVPHRRPVGGRGLVDASQKARLVVVGSSGAGPLTGLLLGSTTRIPPPLPGTGPPRRLTCAPGAVMPASPRPDGPPSPRRRDRGLGSVGRVGRGGLLRPPAPGRVTGALRAEHQQVQGHLDRHGDAAPSRPACTSPKPTVATVEIMARRVHPVLQARELVVGWRGSGRSAQKTTRA